jgi:hypothetical protein
MPSSSDAALSSATVLSAGGRGSHHTRVALSETATAAAAASPEAAAAATTASASASLQTGPRLEAKLTAAGPPPLSSPRRTEAWTVQ